MREREWYMYLIIYIYIYIERERITSVLRKITITNVKLFLRQNFFSFAKYVIN